MIALYLNPMISQVSTADRVDRIGQTAVVGAQDVGPGWLTFGLCASALILVSLVVHVVVSRKHRKIIIPPATGYAGMVATLMLLIYAAHHHSLVFVIAQFINTLVCVRLLMLIRRKHGQTISDSASSFPVVDPDLADQESAVGKD